MTKTDRFINLILAICRSPEGHIDDKQLREILGNPSKSQYHKYLNELIKAHDQREPILVRSKSPQGFIYKLQVDLVDTSRENQSNLLIFSNAKKANIRVYGDTRKSFGSIRNFPKELRSAQAEWDDYTCLYGNEEEFIQKIFQFADDVEIVGPVELKQKYIEKAQKAVFLNMTAEYGQQKKSAA